MHTEGNILELDHVTVQLGRKIVLDDMSLSIKRREIVGIIGPSGEGKTTLLKTILTLLKLRQGTIKAFGIDITKCGEEQMKWVREQWGVMFQSGALFSSLTVLENIMFPIVEDQLGLSERLIQEIALFKIALVGLDRAEGFKYPSELSGGMEKRVALARALALDPKLLFLDEPTAGLDPKGADDFDDLILRLHKDLDVTVIIVTHDLDTLWRVPDRVIFIAESKILAICSMEELLEEKHPVIRNYLSSPRGQHRKPYWRKQSYLTDFQIHQRQPHWRKQHGH